MHRINLRGPWQCSLVPNGDAIPTAICLERTFNRPTNLDHGVNKVELCLILAKTPQSVQLNNHILLESDSLAASNQSQVKSVSSLGVSSASPLDVGRFDIQSILVPYNRIAIEWSVAGVSDLAMMPKSIRLQTAEANLWLLDAWLEIFEQQ